MAEEENMTKIDLPPGAEVMPSDGFDGMTGDDSLDVAAMGGKQGGVCCRCCCDYRRAVIIMSSVSIFLGFLGIISAFRGQPDGRFGDDQVAEDIQEITKDYRSQQVLLACIGFVFAGLSLFGSLKFRWNLVAATVVWALVSFLLTVIFNSRELNEILDYLGNESITDENTEKKVRRAATVAYVFGALLAICWVYPSIWLVMELRSGIMTAATYPRERHSCCCV